MFICGDYAFLCVIHGLSGASGKYGITCTLHAPTKLAKTAKLLACSPAALNHVHTHVGRHCCLWCHIKSDQLKVAKHIRGTCRERSLATLDEDYSQFMAAGGDIRNAKDHNNVIAPYFFEVPLDQVNYQLLYM